MRTEIALALIAGFILIPPASAIDNSFLFQSVGYGRGWVPYTCLMDHNTIPAREGAANLNSGDAIVTCTVDGHKLSFVSRGIATTSAGDRIDMSCPFEDTALTGYYCSPSEKAGVPTGAIIQVTIPDDVKLVTKDGFVLKSTTTDVCPDDSVSVQKGSGSGEWWFRGGVEDSPPIQWIPDVKAFVREVMDYHKKTNTTIDVAASTQTFEGGYTDSMFSIPISIYSSIKNTKGVYEDVPENATEGRFSLNDGSSVAGNLLCSLERKGDQQGQLKPGDDVDVEYDVLCTYYYFAKGTREANSYPRSTKSIILRQPMIITGTGAKPGQYGLSNVDYKTADDLFKVGTIKLATKLKVVEPTKVQLAVQTKPSQVNYAGKEVVKLVITNTQTGMAQIDDVDVGAGNKIIFCDKKSVGAGESAECLASVGGAEPVVKVSYSETSCGKEFENLYVSSGEFAAGSCETDFDCKAGACCAGLCRANGEGTCEDIDGNGIQDTWVPK